MIGYQLFTTGMVEVPKNFNRNDKGTVSTQFASVVEDTPIYKTVKKAESALNKYRCEIFDIANTLGNGKTRYAKEYYLMEVDYDEKTNIVNNWISIWAYAPYKNKHFDDEITEKFDF